MVPIELRKSSRTIRTFALIDSGADHCIFPASLAGSLGIQIPNTRSCAFSGTAADSQVAYFETIEMGIWSRALGKVVLRCELDVGFCSTLEHTGFGLLGQNGFFSRFKVTFNHAEGYFEIE